MSELNIEVVREFITQVLNGRNLDEISQFCDRNIVWHSGNFAEVKGVEDYKRLLINSFKGLEDKQVEVDDILAVDNKVVVRFTSTATNTGPFMGYPTTERKVSWPGMAIYKLRDYRIREAWFVEDVFGMMTALENLRTPN